MNDELKAFIEECQSRDSLGDHVGMAQLAEEGQAAAHSIGDIGAEVRLAYLRCEALRRLGSPSDAASLAEKILLRARDATLDDSALSALITLYSNLVSVLLDIGDVGRSELTPIVDAAERRVRASGHRGWGSPIRLARYWIEKRFGTREDAIAELRATILEAAQAPKGAPRALRGPLLSELAAYLESTQRYHDAIKTYELAADEPDTVDRQSNLLAQHRLEMRYGDPRRGLEAAAKAAANVAARQLPRGRRLQASARRLESLAIAGMFDDAEVEMHSIRRNRRAAKRDGTAMREALHGLALFRLRQAAVAPAVQARHFLNAAWRYCKLAHFTEGYFEKDPRASFERIVRRITALQRCLPSRVAAPAEEPLAPLPAQLPVLALRGSVLFPFGCKGIAVVSPGLAEALRREAVGGFVGVVTEVRRTFGGHPGAEQLHEVGVCARIEAIHPRGADRVLAIVKGLRRFRVVDVRHGGPCPVADVVPIEDRGAGDRELLALTHAMREPSKRLLEVTPGVRPEDIDTLNGLAPLAFADMVSSHLCAAPRELLELLSITDLPDRLARIAVLVDIALEAVRPMAAAQQSFQDWTNSTIELNLASMPS